MKWGETGNTEGTKHKGIKKSINTKWNLNNTINTEAQH